MNVTIESLSKRSTDHLITLFILTGMVEDPDIPTVRGWIMDELENRDPEAFNAWLEQEAPEDEDLKKFFKV